MSPTPTARRCRRVRPSEISRPGFLRELVVERIEDDASSGDAPVEAWARWHDALARADEAAFESALRKLVDEHITMDMFVCEGDE